MAIPVQLIEPLSHKIARLFTLTEVNWILLKTTGDRLYDLVPRGNPDPDTISELMDRISARSFELAVLGEMLARRSNDAEFATLVKEAAPSVRKEPASIEANVASVVQGLDAVRTRLVEPAVMARLRNSTAALQLIASTIDSLDAYTTLHECLSHLQAKQFSALREAARHLPDNPAQAVELRVFHDQLRSACLVANQAAAKLHDSPTDLSWIKELEEAGDAFHAAIARRDAGAGRRALNRIARIMRSTPPRLNMLIFDIATHLPLDFLASTVEQGLRPAHNGPVAAALQSLRLIFPTIRARVAEHNDWQEADILIAELDQLIEHPSPQLIDEFADEWLDLKATVLELTEREAGARWATDVKAYVRTVDDSLSADAVDAQLLKDAFSLFRGDAQYRFLVVGSRLRADCTELVKIGEPPNQILLELGAGPIPT